MSVRLTILLYTGIWQSFVRSDNVVKTAIMTTIFIHLPSSGIAAHCGIGVQ